MSPCVLPILRRLGFPMLVPGALLLLAACSSSREQPKLVCPRPAIIDELASVERYRPGTPEQPENLAYRAALENITGTCRGAGNDLDIKLGVELVVEPGPAFMGPAVDVPYFVAVVGPEGNVIDRRDYTAKVTVPPGQRRGGTEESFSQRFVGLGRVGAAGYRVLFGFALPNDEALRRAPAS